MFLWNDDNNKTLFSLNLLWPKDGNVKPPKFLPGYSGTTMYLSLNAHKYARSGLGRRDDLWSFFYMMAEFTIGQLPWIYMKENILGNSNTSAKDIFRDKTRDMKETYDHTLLIKNLPQEFNTFLEHLQSLNFEDRPNYLLLLGIFEKSLSNMENWGGHYPEGPQCQDWLMG